MPDHIFLAFAGDRYYPSGGSDDLLGVYASETEALRALIESDRYDWCEVLTIYIGDSAPLSWETCLVSPPPRENLHTDSPND